MITSATHNPEVQPDSSFGVAARSNVTVGTVVHEGVVYEVGWPRRIDDETKPGGHGVLYRGGQLACEFINQDWGPGDTHTEFSGPGEVLAHAKRFLMAGGAR